MVMAVVISGKQPAVTISDQRRSPRALHTQTDPTPQMLPHPLRGTESHGLVFKGEMKAQSDE